MELEPEITTQKSTSTTEFVVDSPRKPLELLRDTEALLRHKTVATLVPVLPRNVRNSLQETSDIAEDYLTILAEIDLNEISDFELQPVRIVIGLTFVGFGALTLVLLLLYFSTLHPELNPVAQIKAYWYQYIWFVSLGVTGMFILGREAMRSHR